MGFFHACEEVVTQMASRIQGITVEIGGDTTKLSKALESVNKSIKGTQSGLKDVVYVDAPYKVYGFSIQYRRYLTTAAKREREEAV